MLSVAPLITISVAASIRDRAYDVKQPARSTTCSWISIAAVDFDSIASAVLITGGLASREVHVVSRHSGAQSPSTRTPVEEKGISTGPGRPIYPCALLAGHCAVACSYPGVRPVTAAAAPV